MSYMAPPYEAQLSAELRRCKPFILGALDRCGNTHDWEDVVYLIRRNIAHFWPGQHAAIVSELIQAPNFTYCNLWLAGGELEELLEMEKRVADWARALGCKKIIANGRKGWERVLLDYRPAYVSYEKDL